jgi:adrenodoxin-NADP+ reductase
MFGGRYASLASFGGSRKVVTRVSLSRGLMGTSSSAVYGKASSIVSRACRYTRTLPVFIQAANYHVAVVGSGPAAFYTSKYLLDKDKLIHVDMIEKLPIPFGLVRYGVAPDHPEVKSVSSQFEELFTQHGDRFRYFGNVEVRDKDVEVSQPHESVNNKMKVNVSLEELQSNYRAVVLAYGAASETKLNIPGKDMKGIYSARQFVNWYNGHPAYAHIGTDLDLANVKEVVIVGNGNVAIDCARVLGKSFEELYDTDISPVALEALKSSAVETITLVGRRGHVQASFTIKELRELTRLDNAKLIMHASEIERGLTEASKAELKDNRAKTRIIELINKVADGTAGAAPANKDDTDEDVAKPASTAESKTKHQRSIYIRYLLSPKAFLGPDGTTQPASSDRVQGIELENNELIGGPHEQSVKGTGKLERIPCQLVLESIGYRSLPISASLPFDNKTHTVPSHKGRVVRLSKATQGDQPPPIETVKCLYVSGWLKRGPSGIIGTNIPDAKETVSSVLEDVKAGIIDISQSDAQDIDSDPVHKLPGLQDPRVITWRDYLCLKDTELSIGQSFTPPRANVKLVTAEEIMKVVYDKCRKSN